MAKATILLVQNAKTNGNGTKRYLEGTGFEVVWTGSGVAALAAAKQRPVDLILLDASLPDIEGIELCHLFRMRERTSAIPILMLTAPGVPYSSNGKGRGPDDCLAKPYTVSELDVRLAALLGKRTPAAKPELKPSSGLMPQTVPQVVPGPEPKAASLPEQRRQPSPAPVTRTEPSAEQAPLSRSALTPESGPATAERPRQFPLPHGSIPPAGPVAGSGGPMPPVPGNGTNPEAKAAVPHPAGARTAASAGSEVIDPETGLFGRSQFEAMFTKEFKRSVRFMQHMSCMLIDLDGRTMGREADDATLKAIVGLIQSTIREVDTAAWWSGEALIVLLPNTIRNDAVQAAARILEAVAKHPFTWSDSTKVTMSIGVAGLPDRKIDTEQKLIDAAAAACSRARGFIEP